MSIRYDKKLENEINRVVRNFNNKIKRLEKEEKDLLPEKITKQEIKEDVRTRKELYKKLNELKDFSKRGVEETVELKSGTKLSKYELNKLKKDVKIVKSNLTREINKLSKIKPTVLGKEQAGTLAQMGDEQILNLRAKREIVGKNIENLSKEEIKRLRNILNKNLKDREFYNKQFKNNYLEMLTDLGYFYNYDKNKLKEIELKINNLNTSSFIKLFQTERAIKAILEYYPFITKVFTGINPEDIEQDVKELYDNLYDNLDNILERYK